MKILLLDDSATMRRIIKTNLATMGFDGVVEAQDGEAALAKLASEAIDLVITDWAMPSMSGPELVRAIRSSPTHGKLPVLMITGIAQREDIVEAIEAGVNGYIVKPFVPQTLKQKIQEVMGDVAAKS